MAYTYKIYHSAKELPSLWDSVVGKQNILLSRGYFEVLEDSKPDNMDCYFAAFFADENLVGGALFQYLSFTQHQTFQKDEMFCNVKNFLAKKFSRDVMFVGNNMLTGQNAFYFNNEKISTHDASALLGEAVQLMQKKYRKSSLIIYKDFRTKFIGLFTGENFKPYFRFSVQPNMMLKIKDSWQSFDNYLNDFSTKYRSRANTARKKSKDIEKRELDLNDIQKWSGKINILYQNVADNAPFNTFFLPENHFFRLKESMKDNFRIFGYFLHGEMIGFYTLILNNSDVDTYFLGYDKDLQKEKQIYLNMLLDMVKFGIEEKFSRIIFGRTALEIKSTIGAEPYEIFGLIKHNNFLINPFMSRIFPSISPKTEWVQRKPFKD
ncbi:8-amino-7-oxononanoate synthase [Chryseobacterium caseinilyticum]|uniref:8-amino-7-oxononanoate synthase n=1 Tax=Chryseobacterium caseinilyticum TaxID=2771428 RepID=A0ABR8ZFA4_9FLAO|nr:8-amino-7-oxononanoate synthase [Chryseobacterium caseinilyticum]MBD8083973.1 8-amino-7-oxononanoate synthase [Chryseobacterium caseinilyticum]